MLGDTISFNEHWQSCAGSESLLISRSFSAAGGANRRLQRQRLQPDDQPDLQADLNITTYATYADALQQGDTAPTTAAITNPAPCCRPIAARSTSLAQNCCMPNNVETDTAAFRMSRPYAFLNPRENTFEADGEQVNDGVETMARGRLFDSLNVIGGVT